MNNLYSAPIMEIDQSNKIENETPDISEIIGIIYEPFMAWFISIARLKIKDHDDIMDITSEFFVKLCKKDAQFVHDIFIRRIYGSGYIRRMFDNFLIDWFRKEKKRTDPVIYEEEVFYTKPCESNILNFLTEDEIDIYRKAIKSKFQSERYLQVFELIIQGAKNKEITKITGITTPGTYKDRLRKFIQSEFSYLFFKACS